MSYNSNLKKLKEKICKKDDFFLLPLASESLGVRSLCFYVKTRDLSLLVDPGCALGPKKGYQIPHPLEWKQLERRSLTLKKFSLFSEFIFISHYHRDHFKPFETDYLYVYSNPELARDLYSNKKAIFCKETNDLGYFQKKRVENLFSGISKISSVESIVEIKQGSEVKIGHTHLFFPLKILHKDQQSRMGFVQPLIIDDGRIFIFYLGDVLGFTGSQLTREHLEDYKRYLEKIKHRDLSILILDGPPLNNNESSSYHMFLQGLFQIEEYFDIFLIDHHVQRNSNDFYKSLEADLVKHRLQRKNTSSSRDFYVFDYRLFLQTLNSMLDENCVSFFRENPNLEKEFHFLLHDINLNEIYMEKDRSHLYRDAPPSPSYIEWGKRALKKKKTSHYPPLS